MDKDIADKARAWADADCDANAQAELRELLDSGREAELRERFQGPLVFGTAGLRGLVGAGESRMNRAVVRRATWGVGKRVLASIARAAERGVVIGFDGRRMSREFAEDAAGVLVALGIHVTLFRDVVPTPLCAFALAHEGAAAAIMITASHNPPAYNGYKVYWENGAQIVPPTDAEIAQAIAGAPRAVDVPCVSETEALRVGKLVWAPPSIEEAYVAGVLALRTISGAARPLKIAYTPLHGVGHRVLAEVFANAGYDDLHVVASQRDPDAAFPTVDFPNPEEPGAMDAVLELGRRVSADLIIANDPDADRLAVAVAHPTDTGAFVQLTGNEVGVVLGHALLRAAGAPPSGYVVANSIVSSPWLGHIAKKLGARHIETLTGFKWIANRSMQVEKSERRRFLFGYEEALGYTVGSLVRDKDGISAALICADIAADARAKGGTLLTELAAIAREFGLFGSAQVSVTKPGAGGLDEMRRMMAELRASPPAEIDGRRVRAVVDLESGERRAGTGRREPVEFPKSDVLIFELEGDARVIVRPSGTEPKVKFYGDTPVTIGKDEDFLQARDRAKAEAERLAQALSSGPAA